MKWIEMLLWGDHTANRAVPPSGFTAMLTLVTAAAMAFLAVIAVALSLVAGDLAGRWEDELQGTATIRIAEAGADTEARAEAVMTALSQTPGIQSARRIPDDEQIRLLAPWFGEGLPLDKLSLPVMIEVTETDAGPDVAGLEARLEAEAPGAVYDDHGRWRVPLVAAADRLRFLSLFSLTLIALVTGGTVALAASAAIAANAQVIDVLRIVGARDGWIAAAFTRRFTLRAFLGGLLGAMLAVLAVSLIPDGIEAGVLGGVGFDGAEWLWPFIVPFAFAGLAFLATWVAAARRLSEEG